MLIHNIMAALLVGMPGVVADASESEAPSAQFERVERRVRRWQPTAEERRFDEIGWAGGVREAIRLARRHGRPVFLFTHDGHMNVGRC
jgi:hypothetical protein